MTSKNQKAARKEQLPTLKLGELKEIFGGAPTIIIRVDGDEG